MSSRWLRQCLLSDIPVCSSCVLPLRGLGRISLAAQYSSTGVCVCVCVCVYNGQLTNVVWACLSQSDHENQDLEASMKSSKKCLYLTKQKYYHLPFIISQQTSISMLISDDYIFIGFNY